MKGNISVLSWPRLTYTTDGGAKYHISCLIIQKTIVNDIFCQIVGVLYSPDTLNRRYLAKIVLSRLAICHHQHSGQNWSLTHQHLPLALQSSPLAQSSIPLFFFLNLILSQRDERMIMMILNSPIASRVRNKKYKSTSK